jgi:hypothetical protein
MSVIVVAGCAKETPLQPGSPAAGNASSTSGDRAASTEAAPVRNTQVIHVPFFIEDASGGAPTQGSTPLFESRAHQPILAPDGHQVTLDEFNAVEGRASVKCVHQGTHIVLQLGGLIPGGVYTINLLTFKAPGFDGTFTNLIGLGALGSGHGAYSSLRARANGSGTISAIMPGGPLSVFGAIADCALSGEFEFHVVGVYHIDGKTYGGAEAPAGTAVEQFAFIFHS